MNNWMDEIKHGHVDSKRADDAREPILRSTGNDIAHERDLKGTHLGGDERKLKGRYVAAICPRCGGWTMMHGDAASARGREWTRQAYVGGDLIVFWKNPISLGPACPQGEKFAYFSTPELERTCDQ